MARGDRRRGVAGLLSMLVPGAGQLYAGARRQGIALLAVTAALLVLGLWLASTQRFRLATSVFDERAVRGLVAADLAILSFRLFAVVDAWRREPGSATRVSFASLAALTALTVAPHLAAGYVTVRSHQVLGNVFPPDEPGDGLASRGLFVVPERAPQPYPSHLWPGGLDPSGDPPPRLRLRPQALASTSLTTDERPWVTLLLLGSDRGPGNWGERTDTMIVVALQRGTGRAAAFGVPRNLVEVPLGSAATRPRTRFHEPLNALYSFGRTRPELFPGGRDPGATALKQTISRLLGIRVDYYALVDLVGFADMVDALGGVDVNVKERLVDSVTRPAWGEPKPTIDVFPGRTYHFFGLEALAYVRSRKASSDYARMARQRCFLSALAHQVDAVSVLRHFDALAETVERSVRTDIPLNRVPDLLRLAKSVKPRLTSTQTFGREYIARRRPTHRYP